MLAMNTLTDAEIRRYCTAQVFQRGQAYVQGGHVLAVAQQGNRLTASVQGSEYQPYSVTIDLDANGRPQRAECSCPYEGEGFCKHLVATLLAAQAGETMAGPAPQVGGSKVVSAPQPLDLLALLTEEQLRRTVADLLQANPGFGAAFAYHAAAYFQFSPRAAPAAKLAIKSAAKPAPQRPAVSPLERSRDQLRLALTGLFEQAAEYCTKNYRSGRGWHFPLEYLDPQVVQANQLLANGDASAALNLVAMVLDEWIAFIDDYADELSDDNFGELSDIAYDLIRPLADGLLRQELSPAARAEWLRRIDAWEYELGPMDVAKAAALYGWDHPPLVAALAGQWNGQPLWQLSHFSYDAELADLYLAQLRRQQRTPELLNLAKAVGKTKEHVGYVDELADAGKAAEAVIAARELFHAPREALALARKLHAQQKAGPALQIAAVGLALEDWRDKPQLAQWAAKVAEASGELELALKATVFLFANSPSLYSYRDAERLSGSDWPEIKAGLLELLTGSTNMSAKGAIYLAEGMVEEAIALAEADPAAISPTAVIQLAAPTHPEWCAERCKRQAEEIIMRGAVAYYDEAANWLRWARDCYCACGRAEEWQAYIARLIEANRRKYTLTPLLRALQ